MIEVAKRHISVGIHAGRVQGDGSTECSVAIPVENSRDRGAGAGPK